MAHRGAILLVVFALLGGVALEGHAKPLASTRPLASPAELSALLGALSSRSAVEVNRAIARLVAVNAGAAVAGELARRVHVGAEHERSAAVRALTALPQAAARAGDALEAALRDPAPAVRSGAALALASTGARKKSAALVRATRDEHPAVRRAAIVALVSAARPVAERTRRAIGARLSDRDLEVRRAACEAAGRLGLRELEPALLERLEESALYEIAVTALLAWDAPRGRAIARTHLAGDATARATGARLLRESRSPWSRAELRRLLTDEALEVRCAAARALLARGDEVALTFLVLGAHRAADPREALAYVRVLDDEDVSAQARERVLALQPPAPGGAAR